MSSQSTRSIATSAVARKDLIQEAYLRELKAYKPAAKVSSIRCKGRGLLDTNSILLELIVLTHSPSFATLCLLSQSADAHKGNVRDFHAPSAPKAPQTPSSSSLSSELESYASAEPDVAEAASSSSSVGDASVNVGGGAKAFLEEARRDYPKEEAHH